LNALPEVRQIIKELGHADTYARLNANFIPGHNPDLVFPNRHGKEKQRLDFGRYDIEQIQKLLQDKLFQQTHAR